MPTLRISSPKLAALHPTLPNLTLLPPILPPPGIEPTRRCPHPGKVPDIAQPDTSNHIAQYNLKIEDQTRCSAVPLLTTIPTTADRHYPNSTPTPVHSKSHRWCWNSPLRAEIAHPNAAETPGTPTQRDGADSSHPIAPTFPKISPELKKPDDGAGYSSEPPAGRPMRMWNGAEGEVEAERKANWVDRSRSEDGKPDAGVRYRHALISGKVRPSGKRECRRPHRCAGAHGMVSPRNVDGRGCSG